jgi:CRISPR-associated protein Cas1
MLLGIEGTAAKAYWSAFRNLNTSTLPFDGRRSRPPADAVNALLSFGYTTLASEIVSVLHAAGLDPCIGYYHRVHRGRPSLALDVMEPLRHQVIDRLVLSALNNGRFQEADFIHAPRGGIWLSPRARAVFLEMYENAMLATPLPEVLTATPGVPDMRGHLFRKCERLYAYFSKFAEPPRPGEADTKQEAA